MAYDQFVLPANSKYLPAKAKLSEKPQIQIDPKTGALKSYMYESQEYLASPVRLSLYRPATDNDNREKKGGDKNLASIRAESFGSTSYVGTNFEDAPRAVKWNC